jgi:hypothetical protein
VYWLGSFALLSGHTEQCLKKQDVHDCCGFISKLCKKAGCEEAGELYAKAAEVVIESEEKYLAFCEQSCRKCSESKMPKKQPLGTAGYVA